MGRDWINSEYGKSRGTWVVTTLMELGLIIIELEKIPSSEILLDRIKRFEHGARTEARLIALYKKCGMEVEIGPELKVGGRTKKADIKVKVNDQNVYVEVSQASESEDQLEPSKICRRMTQEITRSMAQSGLIEIYLYREPTDEEAEGLINRCGTLLQHLPQAISLEGLAEIFASPLGEEKLPTFQSKIQKKRPVLGYLSAAGKGSVSGQCTLKIPFSDERAQRMLGREAKQLSREFPNLLVLDLSGIAGDLKRWQTLIEGRLQPTLNQRISGVLLMRSGIRMRMETEKIFVPHPNPIHKLPMDFVRVSMVL